MSQRTTLTVLVIALFAVTTQGQLSQNPYQNQQFGGDNIGSSNENCCEDYCYVADEEPYLNFATKTSYDSLNRRSDTQHIIPDCKPVQFWAIIRHGTRLPKASKIRHLRTTQRVHEEIVRNYEQKRSYPDRGRLCVQDYNLFTRWRWNDTLTEEKAFSLTSQGVEEMKLLARRYKSKFSQLFQGPYDERAYYFQYANTEKIRDSYQAYIEGFFASEAFRVHANIMNNDRVMPSDSCNTMEEDNVNRYHNINNEYSRFTEKPEYMQMARNVFRRLGFRYNLNASMISDIYDMCRYEKAWNVQQRSPWCIAFNKGQLKLLEYAEDLKYYYSQGYGNRKNEKLGCPAIKDFYEKFEKTVSGNSDGNRGSFFFTTSDGFLPVLTAFGIAKDYTPITADNYYQQANRNWKTSMIEPFAANLAIALYECTGAEKYKVMFFLNEVPIEYPTCDVGLCNWSSIRQKFQDIAENCNVNDPCSENSASSNIVSYLVIFMLPLIFYLRV